MVAAVQHPAQILLVVCCLDHRVVYDGTGAVKPAHHIRIFSLEPIKIHRNGRLPDLLPHEAVQAGCRQAPVAQTGPPSVYRPDLPYGNSCRFPKAGRRKSPPRSAITSAPLRMVRFIKSPPNVMRRARNLAAFCSGPAKTVFRPHLQPPGSRHSGAYAPKNTPGQRRHWIQNDPGVAPHSGLSQSRTHPHHRQAGKESNHKGPVPVVKAVNGKSGTPLPAAPRLLMESEAATKVSTVQVTSMESICRPFFHLRDICPWRSPPANPSARQWSFWPGLPSPGPASKHPRQEEGEPGTDPSQKIDHLVCGKRPHTP